MLAIRREHAVESSQVSVCSGLRRFSNWRLQGSKPSHEIQWLEDDYTDPSYHHAIKGIGHDDNAYIGGSFAPLSHITIASTGQSLIGLFQTRTVVSSNRFDQMQ